MASYGRLYGSSARSYAISSVKKWKSGEVAMSGQTMTRLFDLLPTYLDAGDKLELIQLLRQQAMRRLRGSIVNITLHNRGQVMAALEHVIAQVQRVGQIEIPADFSEVQRWLYEDDAVALDAISKETEQIIAAARLADLMVNLGTIGRLSEIAGMGFKIKASTNFSIPTASVRITFAKGFWNTEGNMHNSFYEDRDLVVRLQEMALMESVQQGKTSYVDYVLRTLSAEEQAKLRAIAAGEGLRIEVLLKELQVRTTASRGDIDATIATANELKRQGHNSKISSTMNTASGTTNIEIDNRKSGCTTMVIAFIGIAILISFMHG